MKIVCTPTVDDMAYEFDLATWPWVPPTGTVIRWIGERGQHFVATVTTVEWVGWGDEEAHLLVNTTEGEPDTDYPDEPDK